MEFPIDIVWTSSLGRPVGLLLGEKLQRLWIFFAYFFKSTRKNVAV
jgi:hypothetical protein